MLLLDLCTQAWEIKDIIFFEIAKPSARQMRVNWSIIQRTPICVLIYLTIS
jgi:hypothetical protein